MELTLLEIESLIKKNKKYSIELKLLYDSINDFPEFNLSSLASFKNKLSKAGVKSFNYDHLSSFQKSLSLNENAWLTESLESVLLFCNKLDEEDFEKAVDKLLNKLKSHP